MNTFQDRPYACAAPGCFQRFQREDHLLIHRYKHEMTLKFPSIKSDINALLDQTPTPTSFLRDCDEVGLFSELELSQTQEEEEEEESKQIFPLQNSREKLTRVQTLPHQSQSVQPQCALSHLSQTPSQCSRSTPSHPSQFHSGLSYSQCSMAPHSATTTMTPSGLSCLQTRPRQAAPCAMPGTSTMHMNRQLMMNSNMIGVQDPSHSISCSSHQRSKLTPGITRCGVFTGDQDPMGHLMELLPSRQQGRVGQMHLQAQAAHTYQQHCQNQPNQCHTPQQQSHAHPHPNHAHHSPPAHLSQCSAHHCTSPHLSPPPALPQVSPLPQQASALPAQTTAVGGRRRRATDEDPDDRRQKFLERNRAAASRCRQKRKVWVVSLERKAEELTHTNLQLQNEVTSLRSEVTQLKQILLAHKDCPVTATQREAQGPMERLTGSPTQSAIQHHSISTSSSHARQHTQRADNPQL